MKMSNYKICYLSCPLSYFVTIHLTDLTGYWAIKPHEILIQFPYSGKTIFSVIRYHAHCRHKNYFKHSKNMQTNTVKYLAYIGSAGVLEVHSTICMN